MATTNTMADSEQIIRNLVQGKPDSEVTALLTCLHSLCVVRFGPEVVSSSSAFYSGAPADDLTHYNREALIEEMIRLHTFGITRGICLIDASTNIDKDTESQMQPFIALFDVLRQQRLNHLETVGEIQVDALMERKYANRRIARLQEQVSALQEANEHLDNLLVIRRDDDVDARRDNDIHIIPTLDS